MLFTAVILSLAAVAVSAKPVENRAAPIVQSLRKVYHGGSQGQQLSQMSNTGIAKRAVPSSATIKNIDGGISYIASVLIGGQTYDLVVDTGSSNIVFADVKPYVPGPNGKPTGALAGLEYGSAGYVGVQYVDKVSFASLTVPEQSFTIASFAVGLSNGTDGILGLGPVGLTNYSTFHPDELFKRPRPSHPVPTFMNNLKTLDLIPTEVFGVSLKPLTSGEDSADNGEITFGGVDSSKFQGDLTYFPVAKQGLARAYWGLDIVGISLGSTLLAPAASAILDTGTVLIRLSNSAFAEFVKVIGGQLDPCSGLLTISAMPTPNLEFLIGSKNFTLTPDQYVIPPSEYHNLGLPDGSFYTWITEGGVEYDGYQVDTILGQKFLEHYYAVFDTPGSRIGLAPAA